MNAAAQVSDAVNVLSLLLVLVTLFTSAQSSTLQSERTRVGGPHLGTWRRVATVSALLAVVSLASLVSLIPAVHLVIRSHGTKGWESTFWVFLLVWVLLVPLCVWQVSIAIGASRLRSR